MLFNKTPFRIQNIIPSRNIKNHLTRAISITIAMVCVGCGSKVIKSETPPYAESPPILVSQPLYHGLAAYVVGKIEYMDGNKEGVEKADITTMIDDLNKTHLFASVEEGQPENKIQKHVILNLSVAKAADMHEGVMLLKGVLIGLTAFLLSPVIPIEFDYQWEENLQAVRWDGKIKNYSARSSGTISFTLTTSEQEINALEQEVHQDMRYSLINRIFQDIDFYKDKNDIPNR